jgi:hypothetical protein
VTQGNFGQSGGFGPPQGQQGAPQGGFGPSQGGFGPSQGGFGPPQGQQGAPQGGFGPSQGGFGPPQGQQGAPQGGFGPSQGGFAGNLVGGFDPFAKFDTAEPGVGGRGKYFGAPDRVLGQLLGIKFHNSRKGGQMVIAEWRILGSANPQAGNLVGTDASHCIKVGTNYTDSDIKTILAALLGFHPARDKALVMAQVGRYTLGLAMAPGTQGPGVFVGTVALIGTSMKSTEQGRPFTLHDYCPVEQTANFSDPTVVQHYLSGQAVVPPAPSPEQVQQRMEAAAARLQAQIAQGQTQGAPQGGYGAPQGNGGGYAQGAPQGGYGAPQGQNGGGYAQGAPQGGYGAPQGQNGGGWGR